MSKVVGDNVSSLKFSGPFREDGLANECVSRTRTVVPKIRPVSDSLWINTVENGTETSKIRCSPFSVTSEENSKEVPKLFQSGGSHGDKTISNRNKTRNECSDSVLSEEVRARYTLRQRKHTSDDNVKKDLIECPKDKLQIIAEKFDKIQEAVRAKDFLTDTNTVFESHFLSDASKEELLDSRPQGEDSTDDVIACIDWGSELIKREDLTLRTRGEHCRIDEQYLTPCKENSEINKSYSGSWSSHLSTDMFDMLAKLQSSRLDDQRCSPPREFVRMTKYPPDVVLPSTTDFWSESHSGMNEREVSPSKFEIERFAKLYRNIFSNSEHFNFRSHDDSLGSILLSIKICDDQSVCNTSNVAFSTTSCAHVIARLKSVTLQKTFFSVDMDSMTESIAVKLCKQVLPTLTVEKFDPILFPKASSMLTEFDEHRIVSRYKFGLIYQKLGQLTEEEMFSNQIHSKEMSEFMSCIGNVIKLSNHKGYKGGLDTTHGYTGDLSLYETFRGNEIMFHVSTFLPFQEMDCQQVQKKCHIGNDIVAVIFQDEETHFEPSMIKSSFLHAYIVVQHVKTGPVPSYRIKVFAKKDVPQFEPALPKGGMMPRGLAFKEFLLSKLMNAETACYQSKKFSFLEQRTRSELFTTLDHIVVERTQEFLLGSSKLEGDKWQVPGILGTWRRAFSSKVRPSSTPEFRERDLKLSQSCKKKEKQQLVSSPVRLKPFDNPFEPRSKPPQQTKTFLSPNFMRKFTIPMTRSPRRSCSQIVEPTSTAESLKPQVEVQSEDVRKEFLMSTLDAKDSKILNLQAENARLQTELSVVQRELDSLKKEKNNNVS